jgi:DNA-directed RNA polymerase specialized sigma24 family protein
MNKKELNKRIEVLFKEHNSWLLKVAFNITKNREISQDLVSELYMYLLEHGTPKLYYSNSFNLMYLHSYIKTRWLNRVKRDKKSTSNLPEEVEEEEYDIGFDMRLEKGYQDVLQELEKMKGTRSWSSAKIFELYWFGDDTMESLSDKLHISKSTTFLNVKKVKQHIRNKVQNPFRDA